MSSCVARDARRIGALLVLGLLTLASTAGAEDWKFKWSNGFKLTSEDGAFALKFGGRLQADYTFVDADDVFGGLEDGFEFRRARLFFSGKIYERIAFKVQYDFAGGNTDIKDAYIGILSDWGEVQFGHFKEPFSLEEQTSSKYLAFLERSLPIEAFSPGRNSGIGFKGSRGDRFNWGFGAYFDADGFGVSTGEDNINVTGRVAFRPLYENQGKRLIHVGLAATRKEIRNGGTFRFRARPEAHDTSRLVDTESFAADSALILDLETAGVFGPLWFSAEYLQAEIDAPMFGDPSFRGGDVQVGYYLTGEHRRFKTSSGAFDRQKPKENFGKNGGKGAWEIALRYSTLDLTDEGIAGGEQDNVTLAVNWYLNPATRMMINVVHADVDNVGDADFFLLRWQVDF